MVVVKDGMLLLVMRMMIIETLLKGSGQPGRLVQVHLLVSFQIQGIQRRGDGKDCAPLPPKERRSEVGGPRNLFPRLGVG